MRSYSERYACAIKYEWTKLHLAFINLLLQVLGILSEPVDEARAHSVTYSVFFLIVGCIVGLAMFLQVLFLF